MKRIVTYLTIIFIFIAFLTSGTDGLGIIKTEASLTQAEQQGTNIGQAFGDTSLH